HRSTVVAAHEETPSRSRGNTERSREDTHGRVQPPTGTSVVPATSLHRPPEHRRSRSGGDTDRPGSTGRPGRQSSRLRLCTAHRSTDVAAHEETPTGPDRPADRDVSRPGYLSAPPTGAQT